MALKGCYRQSRKLITQNINLKQDNIMENTTVKETEFETRAKGKRS